MENWKFVDKFIWWNIDSVSVSACAKHWVRTAAAHSFLRFTERRGKLKIYSLFFLSLLFCSNKYCHLMCSHRTNAGCCCAVNTVQHVRIKKTYFSHIPFRCDNNNKRMFDDATAYDDTIGDRIVVDTFSLSLSLSLLHCLSHCLFRSYRLCCCLINNLCRDEWGFVKLIANDCIHCYYSISIWMKTACGTSMSTGLQFRICSEFSCSSQYICW